MKVGMETSLKCLFVCCRSERNKNSRQERKIHKKMAKEPYKKGIAKNCAQCYFNCWLVQNSSAV